MSTTPQKNTAHGVRGERYDGRGAVAVVTGGSRGIGLAIAEALLASGAAVTMTGRDRGHLDRARAGLIEADGARDDRIHLAQGDVSNPEAAEAAVRTTIERFGGLDILVNNAGLGHFANVADLSVADWRRIIGTNLDGVFYCCRAAIPAMRARGGGWILNISSLAGKNSFAGGAAYCASKAGLNAFSEALMQEVRYDNIRVSYIMPGSVATEFGGPSAQAAGINRPGEDWKIAAEDVAQVVMDLLSTPARTLPSRIEMRPSRPKK
jgi:NAD(P)-dependent dehydrogenase (short-subunit alcohol dehydrogenase family)